MSLERHFPYSDQYRSTAKEGHEHPPPVFGAPTLIWHLGLSPHWESKSKREIETDVPLKEIHEALAKDYEDTRTRFFEDVNKLLEALQKAAGFPTGSVHRFNPVDVPAPYERAREGEPFYIASPGSIRFTLWWSDVDRPPGQQPSPDALRIKVLAGAHRDYVTLSFYLDAAKPWNEPPQAAGGPVTGQRRMRILSEVDRVRSICEARMIADSAGERAIDREVVPEHGVTPQDADALLAASQYLYAGIWDEFRKAMRLDTLEEVVGIGRVFANFRGLVLATDGLPEAAEPRPFPGSSGAQPFPRFQGNGGIDHTGTRSSSEPNEANAVVKAFWPFVRRVTPDADRKEFVACGVMRWRALYVTALNSPTSFEWPEEARSADTELPSGKLPVDPGTIQPIRYLLITKGEPHRRQIGRIADRINAMGTMRLIALRDYNIIRDASTQIQLRGQELDRMMRKWSLGRQKIRDDFRKEKQKAPEQAIKIQDREDAMTQALADRVEEDLVQLSAALDQVGEEAVHGLHFRINRSRYYVCEFESLLASLNVGNIDTWVSYDQFVTRGLKPAFDFIDGVGIRLLGLRERLQTVLEGIETSALVQQTSATRENTAQLKNIANEAAATNKGLNQAIVLLRFVGVLVAVVALFLGGGGFAGVSKLLSLLTELTQR